MEKDKDFVVNIIQYLQNKYDIIFFITPKDFDVLYNWWEKRIPYHIIKDSMTNVVKRWTENNKEIYSFTNFRYEVKKNLKAFLQLSVGSEGKDNEAEPLKEKNEFEEIEHFFNNFPEELNALRQDFENITQKIKKKESVDVDLTHTYEKLVNLFKDDNELNLKTGIFLTHLAPELRKPEIKQRYRLNYLINKFNIPYFEVL